MLFKSWCIAAVAFGAGFSVSALFTDIETGSQLGKNIAIPIKIVHMNRNTSASLYNRQNKC